MKILGIIPARGGSKGIPGKNIKMLAGKPLLQYTWEVASKSTLLSKVILSTEDDAIINVAKSLGINIPFKRPSNLSKDKSPTLGVIQHALEFYKTKGETFDAICLLQVTSPFRTVAFLEKAIETFVEAKTDSLISVLEVPHEFNPHWTFKANKNNELNIATGEKTIISRRQDLPKAYHRDGSIYLTKTDTIIKDNSLFGNSISYVLSSKETHVNIDTLEDWEKAEAICKTKFL
ncbi:acylneuraminate cytidylyltransferase family protein [Lacinutrix sp. MedPE-SW]|uniref:acylneuraminate cytidylyltransferase family protein n=1 Tax=Lacinutrix sp. MedPE-SW TaxID=1860087 RepID=UPI0009224B67|nr:acylneuraminate cytidylyltransferase family protein [Lacinutrix sp. MedPE-SW]OIQ22715.1 MAG: acylneuraminate cytidylyltransferase [Lacinutrix sp. MedPE-SW]